MKEAEDAERAARANAAAAARRRPESASSAGAGAASGAPAPMGCALPPGRAATPHAETQPIPAANLT